MSIEQPTPKTAKHSPAPWVADGNLIRTKGEGNLVTSVYDHLDMDIDAEEAEANISLITAAPELLEALESIYPQTGLEHDALCPSKPGSRDYDETRCNGCGHARARAAIRKARGESR